jgi:hypothetical protein
MHFALLLFQSQPDPEQIQKIVATILPMIGIFILIGLAIVILPFWFICKKAGFSPWLSMLVLLYPIGALVLLYILAFADWKVAPTVQAQMPYPYPPPPPRV